MPRCGRGRGLVLFAWLAVANVANHPTEGYLQTPNGPFSAQIRRSVFMNARSREGVFTNRAAPHCSMRERHSPAVAAPGGHPIEKLARWDNYHPQRTLEVQDVFAGYTAAPQRAGPADVLRPAVGNGGSTDRAPELETAVTEESGCKLQTYREQRWHAKFDDYVDTLRSPDKKFTREHRSWMQCNRYQHAVGGLVEQRLARFDEEGLDLCIDMVPPAQPRIYERESLLNL